ncbi:MAG: hypothetical protein KDD36_14405 [Flavobacteriales bacterium]|nr:hypothetical protein [Flavobacteriales bacterium]
MRWFYIYLLLVLISGQSIFSEVQAQGFNQTTFTGEWYSCHAKQLYYPGDTIRMRRTPPVNVQVLFDTCGTDTSFVDHWRYTPRNELISTIRYTDKKTQRPTEQKVLYYPCEISPADSILYVPTRKYMKVYKVIYFDKKRFVMVFKEVIKKEDGESPGNKP